MEKLTLRLPTSLHGKIKELAKQEGISINQFISSAAAEKLAALATEDYIQMRAKRASRSAFDAALDEAPDVADEFDSHHDRNMS